jgi:hypothetical protein
VKLCGHCGEANREGTVYCAFCGNELSQTLSVNPLQSAPETPPLPTDISGPELTLMIPTHQGIKPITLPHGERIVLGRVDHENQASPFINLSHFEALDLGVSRIHAVIDYGSDVPTLSDLGSTNGTYLNGRKLAPHEAHILRYGDEIRLARLKIYVYLQ